MARVKKTQAPPASKITPQDSPDFKNKPGSATPDFKKTGKTPRTRHRKQPPLAPDNKTAQNP